MCDYLLLLSLLLLLLFLHVWGLRAVFGDLVLQHVVEIRADVQVSILVVLKILKVTNEYCVNTGANNVRNNMQHNERDHTSKTNSDHAELTAQIVDYTNCQHNTNGSEKDLAHKQHETADDVHDHAVEEIAWNEIKTSLRCVAETVTVHSNIDIGELVDIAYNSLNATKEAL